LDACAEMFILTAMKDELQANNWRKSPIIEVNKDMDTFSQDIIRLWTNQTHKHIPVILVNLSYTHTGLKLIPNPFDSNAKKWII
jgi:hypothetical protein